MTTAQIDARRLPADQARITVREERGRLVLTLWAKTWAQRQELIEDMRRAFPGHGDRCWRKTTGLWSFPLRHRAALRAWCECWCACDALVWDARTDNSHKRAAAGVAQ